MGWDLKRISVVHGDLTKPKLRADAGADASALSGQGEAFLPPGRDLRPGRRAPKSQQAANIDGTQHALELAAAIKAGCFHHTSSIAAAGLYPGIFREDMFDEAEGLDDPYFRTKHDSEGLVRKRDASVPWRIYRPGMVVGHSQTGEIDKIDGPYYLLHA